MRGPDGGWTTPAPAASDAPRSDAPRKVHGVLIEAKSPQNPSPAAIVAVYLLVGTIWILASDALLSALTSEAIYAGFHSRYQTLKGLGFVATTAAVLYLLLSHKAAAEKALRRSLVERERDLLEAQRVGLVGSWLLDGSAGRLTWSPIVHQILGTTEEAIEATHETLLSRIHPDDRTLVEDAHEHSLTTGEDLDLRYRIYRQSDEALRWIHERGQVSRSDAGELRLVGTIQDITALQEAQDELRQLNHKLKAGYQRAEQALEAQAKAVEALRESEARFLRAVGGTHEGLWDWDLRTDDVWFSDRNRELLGYTKEEFPDRIESFFNVAHPDDKERIQEAVRKHIEEDEPYDMEFRLQAKSGEYRWIRARGIVTHEDGVPARFSGSNRDITAERRLEELLRRAQRLESVGFLAGGIAHDFNNMLSAILGFGELALQRLDQPGQLKRAIEQMLAAANRSEALTNQLLAFSGRQVLAPRKVSLEELLTDVHRLLQRTLPESIDMVLEHGYQGTVTVDPGRLEQSLVNLAINARDAMPSGGQLTIRTEPPRHYRSGEALMPEELADGDYVLIQVIDTGQGIDEEIRQSIFDPFFTTKGEGEGTGLGLASVHGFVNQCGGWISVDSNPGEGTTFSLYLPHGVKEGESSHDSSGQWTRAPSDSSKVLKALKHTVLLAEDEDLVREFTCDALEVAGFRVLAAANGEDAIKLFESESNSIDILVCDMVMPGVQGLELYEHIHALRPELPILFTSGYSEPSDRQPWRESDRIDFLPKPLRPRLLVQAVQNLLAISLNDD